MTRRAALATLSLTSLLRAASPENWPQYRGAGARGISGDDPRLPDRWSTSENIVWKTLLPGIGWSSPIVWGDRVFLTTAVSEGQVGEIRKGFYNAAENPQPPQDVHHWEVYALDWKTGDIVWRKEVHSGAPKTPTHLKNSYASETPVTDGERVYAHFGHLGTYCLDWNGNVVWSKEWQPYATVLGWGTGSSPALHEGRLYIVNDNQQNSYLLALDKKTGEEIWRVARDEQGSWATPYVWRNENRTELVVWGSNRFRSYDFDGKLLWEFAATQHSAIPTPFSAHGLLYVASAFGPVYAIRPGGSGDISLRVGETTNEMVAWSLPNSGPYNTSPLVYDDYYYTLLDRGFFTCHDARTGREVYGRQRIDREAGTFTASPWAYNGKIFCLSEDGDTFVIEAGPEFNVLRKNPLGEFTMATPAITHGSLLLRTESALYRIGDA